MNMILTILQMVVVVYCLYWVFKRGLIIGRVFAYQTLKKGKKREFLEICFCESKAKDL